MLLLAAAVVAEKRFPDPFVFIDNLGLVMTSNSELREMSDEQLEATANEAAQELFRLRFQSQSERLNTPSDIRKNRRLIARIKTIQTERSKAAATSSQGEA
jgi:large subunit ribosomal protein L29